MRYVGKDSVSAEPCTYRSLLRQKDMISLISLCLKKCNRATNWSVLDNEFHNIALNGTIVVIAYAKTDT